MPVRGEDCTGRIRGFGTREAGASRTSRRWTPYLFGSARIELLLPVVPADPVEQLLPGQGHPQHRPSAGPDA
ncbi:hypothetical protein OIE52_36980 [Streptomyces canus]|uniref:hypothetical protein n=1 Tax=Streptomyces canus TaxID=58343 RepID=UPI0030E1AAE4